MTGRWERLVAAVRKPGFDRVLVPIALVVFAAVRAAHFEERDPYWEARAGMENLTGWPLARPDTWSWAGVEGLWYQNSPLWNSFLGLGYQTGGFWGFFLVTAALLTSYLLLSYRLALRLGARRLPALAAIFASVSPALAMLSPRGTLAAEVVMLGSVLVVIEWSRHDSAKLPTWLAGIAITVVAGALSTLGNWLHLSFLLIGPGLAGIWGLVWLLTPAPWARRLVLICGGAVGWVAGVFLSPYGLWLGLERTQVVQQVCAGLILEWTTPFSASISKVFWLMVFAASFVAVGVVAWLTQRFRSRQWGSNETGVLALAVTGVPAAVAGWFTIRFLGIALLTLAAAAAVVVTGYLDSLRAHRPAVAASRWSEYTTGGFWRVVMTAVLVVLAPGWVFVVALHSVPAEADLLRQLPQDCRLFSASGISGVSILVRPDVQVWIDGRADFYGRDHLKAAYAYFDLSASTLVPVGATCILLDAAAEDSTVLAAAVDASPDWQLVATDGSLRLWLPSR